MGRPFWLKTLSNKPQNPLIEEAQGADTENPGTLTFQFNMFNFMTCVWPSAAVHLFRTAINKLHLNITLTHITTSLCTTCI